MADELKDCTAIDNRWMYATFGDINDAMNYVSMDFDGGIDRSMELSRAVIEDERQMPSYQMAVNEEERVYCSLQLAWSALSRATENEAWERALTQVDDNQPQLLFAGLFGTTAMGADAWRRLSEGKAPSDKKLARINEDANERAKRALSSATAGLDGDRALLVLSKLAGACLNEMIDFENGMVGVEDL